MAEPEDTINNIGNGPRHWWRFSSASGDIPDEGSAAPQDLKPLQGETGVSGAFNGTYQFETNPFGDGFGIRFNGQGGLKATNPANVSSRGTMFVVYRTIGAPGTQNFHFGFAAGFDIDYCQLAIQSAGDNIIYRIQDAGNDDENWKTGDVNAADSAVHSMSVSPPVNATSDAVLSFDGSIQSTTFSGDDNVPNDHWWQDFTENVYVGIRGGVDTFEMTNMVAYELLLFDFDLTAQQLSDVHDILTTLFIAPLAKHQRRRGRRVFNEATFT